ncbi:hypothetical protein [Pseudoalteromonas luteoviolacea]|uniref:hypothetical protein n=1 Tax=Pseudoalteromonas luteoviolacea TaxID=43657 RepID=UPI001B38BA43|nr:hypothetical protein [Pseudoalteromonas luteoviolacea]MBQ4838509.1 hypothetical protein [Pseudoalteromonas luteoviolacea]
MVQQVKIYPNGKSNPTLEHSDSNRANLGICFSGGGSRALTCAWGQMLGLDTLNLLKKARYISSVSGGTWASSIYSFLPQKYSDEGLLGEYITPANLSVSEQTGKFNINQLTEHSFGNVPAGMGIDNLLVTAGAFIAKNKAEDHQWLWTDIVGQHVLSVFNLRAQGEKTWTSTKSFSLSESYAQQSFPDLVPSDENFFYLRAERPFIIMNNNIMLPVTSVDGNKSNIVQLPNQATAISAGAKGQTPDGALVGGGQVESYAYASTLQQDSASESPVKVTISERYALIDIVSTSSSFFANTIASAFSAKVNDPVSLAELIDKVMPLLSDSDQQNLLGELESNLEKDAATDLAKAISNKFKGFIANNKLNDIADFIPRNNYWPIGVNSQNYPNTLYTDGGTLDNTGIIGILSQTDTGAPEQVPLKLVVFDNTSTPLVKKGKVIAGGQAAPLFGIDYDNKSGDHQVFNDSQKDPTHPAFKATSLLQVFENSDNGEGDTAFSQLVSGLYQTNTGKSNIANSQPAFHQMTLTTVENTLASISSGRQVEILYVQNAKMLDWQNSLQDATLKSQILAGQKGLDTFSSDLDDAKLFAEAMSGLYWDSDPALEKKALALLKQPAMPFANFPYYSTFLKIGLEPKESNALSQMWAWAIADNASTLKNVLAAFINDDVI